ncbi:hypothetical protein [Streptomyces poonensis]|uniref:Uncharacterized protein n=1 Tax=Streptomyces poonensis TaxID=68255 RepID=A0A918UT36_9ACTN|nr:hypothetical protein [Streptomyces poonensis]GGZ32025.1 hypothetical protein GCM10010365_60890 [Streptomyces poonensis]GLJ93395.1 hypothetical protein GCM10017589_60070 [Streptomyces poonensis]
MTAATADLGTHVPKARARARVLASPAWSRLPGEDRYAHRSGVEPAYRTNQQVRRSGLCLSCWMRGSEPDILVRDGGGLRPTEGWWDEVVHITATVFDGLRFGAPSAR